MIEELIDFNIDNIWNYFSAVILAIIILFFTHHVNIWFESQETNKRIDYFLQFLRYNKTIDECINKLIEKSELKTFQSWEVAIGAIILGFVYIILFSIIFFFAEDLWISVSILALINFGPYFGVIKYIKFAYENPLENTHLTFKRFELIKYFLLISNSFLLNLIGLSYLSQSKIESISISLFIISIAVFLSTTYGLIKGKEVLIFALKSSLNEDYLDKFPNICIKVINENLCGKLQNIFDNNLIILCNKGQIIAIEWDEIITMSLNEKTIHAN